MGWSDLAGDLLGAGLDYLTHKEQSKTPAVKVVQTNEQAQAVQVNPQISFTPEIWVSTPAANVAVDTRPIAAMMGAQTVGLVNQFSASLAATKAAQNKSFLDTETAKKLGLFSVLILFLLGVVN